MAQSWYVYVVRCRDDSLYTGITTELERRIEEHNHSPKGARYTRARRPVELVYSEALENRSDAASREYEIKQLSPEQKRKLIKSRQYEKK